jgi:hypothetical protein
MTDITLKIKYEEIFTYHIDQVMEKKSNSDVPNRILLTTSKCGDQEKNNSNGYFDTT